MCFKYNLYEQFIYQDLSAIHDVFFISSVTIGQYGNEWVNQGQTYYKIKVGSTGIGLEVLIQNLPKSSFGIHL